MSKTLIEEALADAQQLKKLAEENAKQAIVEAVTPRIKQLIESHLLGEGSNEPTDDSTEEESSDVNEGEDEEASDDSVSEADESYELSNESLRAIAPLLKANSASADRIELNVVKLGESVRSAVRSPSKSDENVVATVSELFAKIEDTYSQVREASSLDGKRKDRLAEKLESYYAELNEEFKEIAMKKFLKEAEGDEMGGSKPADGAAPAPQGAAGSADGEDVVITLKGLKDIDADSLNVDVRVEDEDDDGDADDQEQPAGDSAPAGDEGGSNEDIFAGMGTKSESRKLSDDTILEFSETELARALKGMKAGKRINESDSDVGQRMPKGGKIPVDDFGGGHDDGDPWLDHDVTTEGVEEESVEETQLRSREDKYGSKADFHDTMIEIEMEEEGDSMEECGPGMGMEEESAEIPMEGADMEEEGSYMEESEMEEEAPVAESRKAKLQKMLRTESARIVESRKKFVALKTEAAKCRGTARGAQLSKRAVVESQRLEEAKRKVAQIRQALKKEGANSAPSKNVVKENAELRTRLEEAQLLNAQLLYANRLMQTEGVTKAMRQSIINALDSARSLREVKEVYAKLSEKLKSRKTVTESAARGRVIGSGSRVGTSSAAPLNESANTDSIETDRWATLAGLKK